MLFEDVEGPAPGSASKQDIAVGPKGLIEQMNATAFVTKGGIAALATALSRLRRWRMMESVACGSPV